MFNLGSYKALYMDGGDGCVTRKNRTLQSFVHVTELVHVKVEYIMCISPQFFRERMPSIVADWLRGGGVQIPAPPLRVFFCLALFLLLRAVWR